MSIEDRQLRPFPGASSTPEPDIAADPYEQALADYDTYFSAPTPQADTRISVRRHHRHNQRASAEDTRGDLAGESPTPPTGPVAAADPKTERVETVAPQIDTPLPLATPPASSERGPSRPSTSATHTHLTDNAPPVLPSAAQTSAPARPGTGATRGVHESKPTEAPRIAPPAEQHLDTPTAYSGNEHAESREHANRHEQTASGHATPWSWLRIVMATFVVSVCTGLAGLAYGLLAPPTYTAREAILVQPAPYGTYATVSDVGALVAIGDARTALQTAGILLTGAEVDRAVADNAPEVSAEAVAARITVAPIGESTFVGVTATGSTPAQAEDLAKEYATKAVELHQQRVKQTAADLLADPSGRSPEVLDELAVWRANGDPALQVVPEAAREATRTSLGPAVTATLGAAGGALAGFGLALLISRGRRVS